MSTIRGLPEMTEHPDDDHAPDWTLDPDGTGAYVVIDTFPEQYSYYCRAYVAADPAPSVPVTEEPE